MTENTHLNDPANANGSPEAIAAFVDDEFETGLSREQLYRSFNEQGNPTLKTMLAVMRALGLDMMAKAHG